MRTDFFEAKDILNVLDVEPVVFEEQLNLGNGSRLTICAAKEK
jgi:hypothetical protein